MATINKIEINLPEGYKIDEKTSTSLYINVIKEPSVYDCMSAEICKGKITLPTISIPHMNKIEAINKLLILANYLNNGWLDNDKETFNMEKWYMYINKHNKIVFYASKCHVGSMVYFKSQTLAQRALDILGEEVIRKALSIKY